MTYQRCRLLIESGNYNEDMLIKLDVFLLAGRITAEQYSELVQLMENK